MKRILRFIHYAILLWAVFHGVKTGLTEGVLRGLLAFTMFIFFYFVVYRLLFGPRDLSYGYKNGYRSAMIHEDWRGTGAYEPTEVFEKEWTSKKY